MLGDTDHSFPLTKNLKHAVTELIYIIRGQILFIFFYNMVSMLETPHKFRYQCLCGFRQVLLIKVLTGVDCIDFYSF